MARLWTDVIDPQTLTGYSRQALSDYEAAKGTLARWLPNREVADSVVRFMTGGSGLVEEARYRSFDAEPEFGKQPTGKRVTVDLPPLSQQGIISERDQVRLRNADDEVRQRILAEATRNAVRAVADRSERQRGTVLVTGQATIAQDNYSDTADFGRDPSMAVTAGTLWSDAAAAIVADLEAWVDHYVDVNGEPPGALVTSSRVARILSSNDSFSVQLAGGASRPAGRADVNAILAGIGLPEITVYDRKTSSGRVIPDDRLLLLPSATDVAGESELGATFWGQTLASSEPGWEIPESEQPGIVAAAFTHEGIPPIRHTYVDALTLPVGANMNLSFVAKVL